MYTGLSYTMNNLDKGIKPTFYEDEYLNLKQFAKEANLTPKAITYHIEKLNIYAERDGYRWKIHKKYVEPIKNKNYKKAHQMYLIDKFGSNLNKAFKTENDEVEKTNYEKLTSSDSYEKTTYSDLKEKMYTKREIEIYANVNCKIYVNNNHIKIIRGE